ncbi:MAG: DnaB-like helicase C-terminal domain-containing protein [Planctomycetota bacterium]
MNDQRMPPHDTDAEMAVLGSLLMGCDDFDEVVRILATPEVFYTPTHRTIFEHVRDMREADEPIDLLVFQDRLRRNKVDNIDDLCETATVCADSFADIGNATHYARIVAEQFRKRELIRLGDRLSREAYDVSHDSSELSAKYAGQIENVGSVNCSASLDAVELFTALAETLKNPAKQFIPTGLLCLDMELSGLERGAVTILAARPSVGKTALGLQFAVEAARDNSEGCSALFVSVEMPRMAIAARLVGLLAERSVASLRSGVLSVTDRHGAIEEAARMLSRDRLFIIDDISNVRDIVAVARSHVRRGVGLVVVDYLQLCQPGERSENRNLAVAAMSAAFKRLAQQTGAAVVVLSQLNRDLERSGRMPSLSDLRDSGAIEQDADVVMLLHREDESPIGDCVKIALKVAKNRNGPTFEAPLGFHRPTMRFRNYSVGTMDVSGRDGQARRWEQA